MIFIKKHKPVSVGNRGLVSVVEPRLYKGKPYRKLVISRKNKAGRNNIGRITIWHRGGGHKRNYRIIDWKRNKDGIPGIVERLEYDPNRSPYIALILYSDGERRYIIANKGIGINDQVQSGIDAPISIGNCLPLNNIPIGSIISCIEIKPGKGAQLVRSAGCSAQLLARDEKYSILRLKSGEVRKILSKCRATIGEIGKNEHNLIKLGKAGRSRWMNRKPKVRGVAMNPVDHPMGGGEGRSSGGRPPCSPWGLAEGTKTRNKKRDVKLIIRKRKNKSDK